MVYLEAMKITKATQQLQSREVTLALSPRERQILALRRGISFAHSDLFEAAQRLDVPRTRVNEIKAKAEMMLVSKIAKQGE